MADPLISNPSFPPPSSTISPSLRSPSSASFSSSSSSSRPFTSHSDYLPSDCEKHSCWNFSSAQRPLRIRVTMGPCSWKYCSCRQGTCVTVFPNEVQNCGCGHAMADHEDYGLVFPIAERTELVEEIFVCLIRFPIVRINGTPASGKTTLMKLMTKHLLKNKEDHKPIYVLIGWEYQRVKDASGWAKYLEEQTGINGFEWISHSGYLFLDEAQESYQDTELWAGLFKDLDTSSNCRILLFTSYGSPDSIYEGFDKPTFRKTPMTFDPAQQISLNPDYSVVPDYNPVGLLLGEGESMKLIGDFMKSRHSSVFTGSITEDFKHGVW
ncbi:conserved hypothetical protein [Talaromyces stipitatus ATCC 10500]|uniref:Uncharacterized protein n=1 Tax=Talaromyces stipitatus (strain ATCC 10500 / CBS 375.48 / QM 6759 / NRRL 1006) TaxID=441959 RepID=B8M174_TALSN|nr:uncharacterized protein TSTA_082490 [Talaromyces stipitatus ATCC 10500]EED21016.1 conserved hypothetical protein [Talaromyces stipitatus ATCC 10500]